MLALAPCSFNQASQGSRHIKIRQKGSQWPLMPMTTRRKSSGLISARAATADAQSTQRESFLFIFLCGEGALIPQVMKRFLSCGKLQQNRHQGIPRQTGVSSLTNPARLGGGALSQGPHRGLFPSSSSQRWRYIVGTASPRPAGPGSVSAAYFRGMNSCHGAPGRELYYKT